MIYIMTKTGQLTESEITFSVAKEAIARNLPIEGIDPKDIFFVATEEAYAMFRQMWGDEDPSDFMGI